MGECAEKGVDFTKPWAYADICFAVEERRVYASKMILSMWSPVFEAMFSSDFKEKNAKEIKLPGKKHSDVIEFVKVLHPPNKDIGDDNVLILLPLVQEYQIESLRDKCEEYLLSEANSVKNFLIAQKFELKKLLEANMSYLKRAPVARLKKSPDFDKLDQEIVMEVMMEKCEKFETHLESLREIDLIKGQPLNNIGTGQKVYGYRVKKYMDKYIDLNEKSNVHDILLSIILIENTKEELRLMGECAEKGVDFTKPWAYADICFAVEERRVYASKMILSMWSPVFEAMFSSDFKEKNAKEIKLPGKKHSDVIEFVKVLHPPNKDIGDDNVLILLPLVQEYQIESLRDKCEEYLLSEANSVKNFLIAQKFELKKLLEANMSYLKRAPVARLKKSPDFDKLDQEIVMEVMMEKCEKFETHLESLREIRMVLERKKPTTFPGAGLLCDDCTGAREQQVDCNKCMKSCCQQLTEILRNLER